MLSGCECHDVGYIVGLAKNARLNDRASMWMACMWMAWAQAAHEHSGEKQRLFADLHDAAKTWTKRRRAIARLEHGPKGPTRAMW